MVLVLEIRYVAPTMLQRWLNVRCQLNALLRYAYRPSHILCESRAIFSFRAALVSESAFHSSF